MPHILQRRPTRARNFYSDSVDGVEGPGNENEELLIAAATKSELSTIRDFVESKDVNFNCTDLMGRTAIQIAVENEDVELLDILIPMTSERNIMYSLLDALDDGKEGVAIAILKHPHFLKLEQAVKESKKTYDKEGKEHTSFNEEDFAPIIVAAQKDLYEALKLFLSREYVITPPHELDCICTKCKDNYNNDSFRFAHQRLHIYRALASESYMSLNSDDPILNAFRLRQKLLLVGNNEKHFRAEYHALAEQLSNYVVKLLDRVYGSEELDIILNKKGEAAEDSYTTLARVKLAIKCKEKKFVAHPSCQMRVSEMFYSGFPRLQKANLKQKLPILAALLVAYPLLAMAYIFAPRTQKLRFMRAPATKFFGYTVFYIIMLGLVFGSTLDMQAAKTVFFNISSTQDIKSKFKLENGEKSLYTYYVRSANMNTMQIMILIWVVGSIWQELKELYSSRWGHHFSSFLNWIDIVMLTLYTASYILRVITHVKISQGIEYFTEFWRGKGTPSGTWPPPTQYHYDWINPDRHDWQQNDILIIAEVLFAIANIINFSRFIAILPAFEMLGPLRISFGLMVKDIGRFMGLFLLVFFAFAIGLANLYWFYDFDTRHSVALATHGETEAEKNFASIWLSLLSCFWSIFGMLDPTILNLDGYSRANYDVIQIVGYIIYGTFMVTCFLVLLNLLIAMMTLSYGRIEHDSDIEWKFARTELYFDFMSPGRTLPVPLNLIPTWKTLVYIIKRIFCSEESQTVKKVPLKVKEPDMTMPHVSGAIKIILETPPETIDDNNQEDELGGSTPHRLATINENQVAPTNSTLRKPTFVGSKVSIRVDSYKVAIARVVKRLINDGTGKKDDKLDEIEGLRHDLFRLRRELGNALELRATEIKQTRTEVKGSKDTFVKDLQKTKDAFLTDLDLTRNTVLKDLASTHISVNQLTATMAQLSRTQDSMFKELIALSQQRNISVNIPPELSAPIND